MNRSNRISRIAVIACALGFAAWGQSARAQATPQARIVSPINNDQKVALKGSTPTLVASSLDGGRLNGSAKLGRLILQLTPAPEQEKAAAALVSDLHDPASPNFHKWLTPAQYGEQYGVADADATKVRNWLESQGMTVHEVSQSRRFIVFSGTVGQVESAFSTELHNYTYHSRGYVANATDVKIPVALSSVVKGIARLHGTPHSESQIKFGKVTFNPKTRQVTGTDGAHYMGPADFAKIYNLGPLYDAGIDGTGQSIAIVGRASIDIQNIRDFRTLFALPQNDPNVIVNGEAAGENPNDVAEAMLDVTWSGAVAPMAQVNYIVSESLFADGIDVSAAYAVDHNISPVISTSYGACEESIGPAGNAFYYSLWQQAAAQGITSFVSSGDSGGAGCDAAFTADFASYGVAVNGIGSTPYNVAVGGTQFMDDTNPSAYWSETSDPTTGLSALSYIPEQVWNESSNDPWSAKLIAGGGGVSTIYSKPLWQTAAGVPSDGMRDVPDISLSASSHGGYITCMYGSCAYGGFYWNIGTSASSPSAAGIMALVNQKMNGQRQGMANYVFYRLASISGVYHDVTVGSNKVPDGTGELVVGYDATAGYDLASGLGSFDATALVNNWATAASGSDSNTTLALGNGQSFPVVHGTPITFQATVKCAASGSCTAATGAVSLTATSTEGGSLGVGSHDLTPNANGSTAALQTGMVPGGTYNVAARYSGDRNYYPSESSTVQVTVTPEDSQIFFGAISGGYITTSPLTITYGEPIPVGVVVAGVSGNGYPTGSLTMTADGGPITPLRPTDYVTPASLTLQYGEKSGLLSSGPSLTSQSSVMAAIWSQLNVGSHTLETTYPGDASFKPTSATYTFNVAKANSLIADFFTLGTPVKGVPVALMGQIALTNNGCQPYGGTITFTDITTSTPQVLGSGAVDQLYCDSYNVPVTFTGTGVRVLKVEYSGDANVNGSYQIYNYVVVNSTADSYVSLSADTPTAPAGSTVMLTANVGSDVRNHVPSGTVTFSDVTGTIGTATPDASGNAVFAWKPAGGTHVITANYSGDSVLNPSSSSPITEQVTDFNLQALPGSVVVRSSTPGTATVTLFPLGGSTQTIQLACANLAAGLSCNFAKSSVTLDGNNPAAVALTITSGATSATNQRMDRWGAALATVALAGLLLPFGLRRKLRRALFVLVLVGAAMYGVGCGGGSSNSGGGANGGTYNVTVTATPAGNAAAAKSSTIVVYVVK